MGWDFIQGATKQDVIAELTGYDSCIKHKSRRERGESCLWMLNRLADGRVIITLALLEKSRIGWGYKLVDESMGPCYYSCPVDFIHEATIPVNEFAKEWRNKVSMWHLERGELKGLRSR